MGYCTSYDIIISDDNPWFHTSLNKISGNHFECYDNEYYADSIKWNNYFDDILKLSKEFPELSITVTGYGDSSEDIWKHYIKNGKELFKQFDIKMLDADIDFIKNNAFK